jgi:phosphopantetheinyl transferase (holo-ACP synthase)
LQVLDALEAAKISPERMRFSLAHADGYALAVGAAVDKADRAIGVDFENASRAVSEALMQRLVAEEELEFELDRIGFWVVKEACFKADAKGGGVLSEYRVCRYDPETGRGEARFFGRSSARDGTWKFKFLRSGPWAIALVAGSFSK